MLTNTALAKLDLLFDLLLQLQLTKDQDVRKMTVSRKVFTSKEVYEGIWPQMMLATIYR